MAAVTICSDFGAQKNKVTTVSTVSPSICHEVMGLDAIVLVIDKYKWVQQTIQAMTPAMKRHLLLGRKAMTHLDSILKSRDITLLTKVHLVKAMVISSSHVWM